jgi:hypothetical protein
MLMFPILINDCQKWDQPGDVQLIQSEGELASKVEPDDLSDPKVNFIDARGVRLDLLSGQAGKYLVRETTDRFTDAQFHRFLLTFARRAYGVDFNELSSRAILQELIRLQRN